MMTLHVPKRGVVTLPEELLLHLGVQPGEKIELDLLPEGRFSVRAARPKGSIDDFIGCLAGKTTKVATIEEINEAIDEAIAETAAAEVMASFNR